MDLTVCLCKRYELWHLDLLTYQNYSVPIVVVLHW
jgi:hypothetical protein